MVAAADSYWLALHTVSAVHTRSLLSVAALLSYSVLPHTVSDSHCVSAVLVPAACTY